MIRYFTSAIFCLFLGSMHLAYADADDPDCSKALVLSTYNESTRTSRDWRIANFLSQEEWKAASSRLGGKGSIYGVPVSASYDEYQTRAQKIFTSHHESLNAYEAREI